MPAMRQFWRLEWRGARDAFTMIELLVSCAVLALVVTVLASTFSQFVGLTSNSGRRLESYNQMRSVFDRISFDLASCIRNGAVVMEFRKNQQAANGADTRNDSMSFLTDARTSGASSRFARVTYEVFSDENTATARKLFSLYRGVNPFLWTDNTRDMKIAGTDWQPLGRGVFRMELSFLKTDGTLVANPPPQDEIAAVICSTASLDESSLGKLSEGQIEELISLLPDAEDGVLPVSNWTAGKVSSLPPFVTQNVRFAQRQFFLK